MISDASFEYTGGHACCTLRYKGLEFVGEATCHPDDMDMESERVGLSIAETRALIKVKCFVRDFEIKPQLKILKHLCSNMKSSTHYNPNSYEAKMVQSQLHAVENDLATISNDIADERKFLKDYLAGKEKLYQRLRAKNQ